MLEQLADSEGLHAPASANPDVGALMPFGPSMLLAFLWMLAVRLGCASDERLRQGVVE